MLGLRHFHGHAIDLFLGDITQFQCDGIVRFGASSPESTLGIDTDIDIDIDIDNIQLDQHLNAGKRHIALAAPAAEQAEKLMAMVYDTLRARGPADPQAGGQAHRITVVVTDRTSHDRFQDALFAAFPES